MAQPKQDSVRQTKNIIPENKIESKTRAPTLSVIPHASITPQRTPPTTLQIAPVIGGTPSAMWFDRVMCTVSAETSVNNGGSRSAHKNTHQLIRVPGDPQNGHCAPSVFSGNSLSHRGQLIFFPCSNMRRRGMPRGRAQPRPEQEPR